MSSGRFSGLLSILLFAGNAVAAGLTVQPPSLYLTALRDAEIDEVIMISSTSAGATSVRFSASPFDMNENGRPARGKPSSRDLSGAIRLSADHAVLGAGQQFELRVRVRVPSLAEGSSWAAVFVEHTADHVTTRIAVPIFVTVAGTERPNARVEIVEAYRLTSEVVVISALLHNDGNTVLRAPVAFSIETHDAIEIASADRDAVLLLPGRGRLVEVHLKGTFSDLAGVTANTFFRFGHDSSQVVIASTAVLLAKPSRPAHTL